MTHEESYAQLLKTIHTVYDLLSAASLMAWDQRVLMPPAAAEARGEALATLTEIAQQHFTSDTMGELLESLREYEESLPFDSDEASIIRVTRRDYEKEKIYPPEFEAEFSRAQIIGYQAWIEAREAQDFSKFLPSLTRIVDLRREQIAIYKAAHPGIADDYDVLLDDFEPFLSAVEVDEVFDRLKAATIPLVQQVVEHAGKVDASFTEGHFPQAKLDELSRRVATQLGVTTERWRLDPTVHPFASAIALDDIRLTTNFDEGQVHSSYFSTMHEFGHGLYESNVGRGLARTGLQRGASMAWHESQSRMWENLIGRGRPHWDWAMPVMRDVFPGEFDSITPEQMYRAVNKLGPSFIRTEADELTYNLHIILRYELERDIFADRVALADLPEAWNSKMREYFGLDVPNDTIGVMQDVHWGEGLFGYFPTYSLGNVVSLQLWQRVRQELPELDSQIASGDTTDLAEWLRENIHQYGRKFTPKELLQRVLGVEKFDPEPLIGYLTAKVNELYG